MAETLQITVSRSETQIAIFEGQNLLEFRIEKSEEKVIGNVYLGVITRVLPGLAAAFVDIGLEQNAFLPMSDVTLFPSQDSPNNVTGEKPGQTASVFSEGQQVLVQVKKDPIGNKGARLTTQISIPSRYLVLTSRTNSLGISQRIENETEKNRLQNMMFELKPNLRFSENNQDVKPPSVHGQANLARRNGFILRTAAKDCSCQDLKDDIDFLEKIWSSICDSCEVRQAPVSVYEDLPLYLRVIRDISVENTESISVDSKEAFEKIKAFTSQYASSLKHKISHDPNPPNALEANCIDGELDAALNKQVKLHSGAYLVFDQTEAMTTIDVNSGKFVNQKTTEQTAFKTNIEATQAIARHLRLRNIGGIIVIDFIDMFEEDHKTKVVETLQRWLESDPMSPAISEITSLGLVQITRRRVRQSLEQTLCQPCPLCKGTGTIKKIETVCNEIVRQINRRTKEKQELSVTICASKKVIEYLVQTGVPNLDHSAESHPCLITEFQIENSYKQEEFRLHFS